MSSQTFTEGVSSRYADPIELAGRRDSSGASSLSSQSWSMSSSTLSSEVISNGCFRPFSSAPFSTAQEEEKKCVIFYLDVQQNDKTQNKLSTII